MTYEYVKNLKKLLRFLLEDDNEKKLEQEQMDIPTYEQLCLFPEIEESQKDTQQNENRNSR